MYKTGRLIHTVQINKKLKFSFRAVPTKRKRRRNDTKTKRNDYAETFSKRTLSAHLIMRVIVIDGRDQTCIIVRARAVRTYVRIYYNQCARTHENGNARTKRNGTRSKRPAHAVETARHGTKTSNFLLIGTVCAHDR